MVPIIGTRLAARLVVLIALPLLLLVGSTAHAATRVSLSMRFEPYSLGKSTTILYKFEIADPLPVESIVLHLPAGIELLTSSLGLSECTATTFLDYGPTGCPPNSIVGRGTAWAEVPISFFREPLQEPATVTAALGPPEDNNPVILLFVEGITPVYSVNVLPSQLLLGSASSGASLVTHLPLIEAWTEGPPVALTRFQATIGPRGITYYKRQHGRRVAYHPKGLALPARCPRHGFAFRADFRFYNGTTAIGRADVPCPSGHARAAANAPTQHRHG